LSTLPTGHGEPERVNTLRIMDMMFRLFAVSLAYVIVNTVISLITALDLAFSGGFDEMFYGKWQYVHSLGAHFSIFCAVSICFARSSGFKATIAFIFVWYSQLRLNRICWEPAIMSD